MEVRWVERKWATGWLTSGKACALSGAARLHCAHERAHLHHGAVLQLHATRL